MPDWFTHTLIGWITGKVIRMDVALIAIGSLLPDFQKIGLGFHWFGLCFIEDAFSVFHTPVGAFLLGALLALFFESAKKAFIALGIGITTHFMLDLLLFPSPGGVRLFFPFSWEGWQFGLVSSADYRVTIIAMSAALLVYLIYRFYDGNRIKKNS